MDYQRTTSPIVTGTSVIGIKFDKGVIIAADTLASYGSLARFTDIRRLQLVGGNTVIGVSGEISDFQYIMRELDDKVREDNCWDDDVSMSPKEVWNYLCRRFYYQRSKMDPFWNQAIVAGYENGKPFMGYVDAHGTHFEDETVASGYGGYIARPLLRNAYRPDLTEEEAFAVIEDSMRILFYRDARSINSVQFATIKEDGITITEPRELETEWEFQQFIKSGFI